MKMRAEQDALERRMKIEGALEEIYRRGAELGLYGPETEKLAYPRTETRYRPDQKRIKGKFAYEGKKDLTTDKKGATISSSEFVKSLRGVGKRYPVRLNRNGLPFGDHYKLDLKTDIEEAVAFAGMNTNREIRNAIFLENDYHIPAKEWQKCKGYGNVIMNGKSERKELHWYQARNIRTELKIKPKTIKKAERRGIMKVRYIGDLNDPLSLMKGHIYECLGYEMSWGVKFAIIVDEDDEDYIYPAEWFEPVKVV
ncbi:MAG: hypothetical protein J6M07_10130 [Ruminococcus sp.]|nr:hypothetical protein [Ruminococcus sp.]